MSIRKAGIWKSLTIIILGGAGLSTWLIGACDSGDGPPATRPANSASQGAQALERVNQLPDGYVLAPGGIAVHKDCVYEVPNGAVAYPDLSVTLNGKKIAQYAACTHARYRMADRAVTIKSVSGDTTNVTSAATVPAAVAVFESGYAITSKTTFNHLDVGNWQVPPNPPVHASEVFYVTPFMETGDKNGVLAPALRWSEFWPFVNSPPQWTIANWMTIATGPNAGIFVSPSSVVNVGDQIWASLDMYNADSSFQYWTLIVKDVTTGATQTSSIAVPLPTSTFIIAEAGSIQEYNAFSCDNFPNGSNAMTYFPRPNLYEGVAYYDRNLFTGAWHIFGPADYGEPQRCNSNQSASSYGTTLSY